MPYHQTRTDVAVKIALRAVHEANPGMSQRQLAVLFHASLRTVNQAVQHSLQDWVAALATAPPGKKPAATLHLPSHLKRRCLSNPADHEHPSLGPGNRAFHKPVHMDDQGDGVDPDPPEDKWQEQGDEGLEAERERQAKKAENGS